MQTILGSGGAIGVALAKVLPNFTDEPIRLVSRNPRKVNESDELINADVLDPDQLAGALKGSDVIYITVGFAYDTKTWQQSWPHFMRNVIDIAIRQQSKVVFFDNIYMYDPDSMSHMTEDTPVNPSSEKGKVRAAVLKMLMDRIDSGELTALVARSADFYGPNIENNSMLIETVFKPLSQGKRANILMNANYIHSFSYVPDIAKAVAMLGNSERSYNQVWHLPTAAHPLTLEEWVRSVAKAFGVEARYRVISPLLLSIMGIFIPVMREVKEMGYQYDRDYWFDSSKFEKAFDFIPTSYEEGIKEVIQKEFNDENRHDRSKF